MSRRHDNINDGSESSWLLAGALILILFFATACATGPSRGQGRQAEEEAIEFQALGLRFRGLVERPADGTGNGRGVLLLGGGLGNDLDWSAPGEFTADGAVTQVTITGLPHADAPAISHALVEQGFTVMRWSTIALDDPLADQWPVRATPRTLADTLTQSRVALAAFRATGSVDPARIILLGHSLGAARACTIAAEDPGVAGLILLSPAYFTRRDPMPGSFEAAQLRVGVEVVEQTGVPCLIVLGELDMSRAVDIDTVRQVVGLEIATVVVLPGVGHQLGPEVEGRIGPVSSDAIDLLAGWAAATAGRP